MAAVLNFYSFYIPKINLSKMRICDAFVEKIMGARGRVMLPGKVLLRNRGGMAFVVEVEKEGGNVYFGKGWAKFVDKSGLESGYVLIFGYDGLMTFDVKIYDHSCCEIQFGSDPNDHDEEEDDTHDDDTSEDQDDDDDDYNGGEEGSENRSDADYGSRPGPKVRNSSKRGCGQRNDAQRTRPYYRHNWHDSEAELLVKPGSLYFVGEKGSRKRSNQLQVSAIALRDFNVELADKIVYIDPHGREYVGKVSRWKSGQTVINKWGTFCKANGISNTDKCVFELEVSKDHKCRSMLVHIIRKP